MRMKYLTGAATVALLMAGAAAADVTVTGTVDVDKDIDIRERIQVDNNINLNVDVNVEAEKFAESIAVANQSNYGNTACTNCAEKRDNITDSANGNTGMLSVNQASGNFNNQGTLISAAIDADGDGETPIPEDADPASGGFAEAGAHADQRNGSPDALAGEGGGYTGPGNSVDSVNILFRSAYIRDSFNTNTGLVYGNQSTGNMANQANVLALAFSLADGGVALSEADLGQVNANNHVGESSSEGSQLGINKVAGVSNSLNGNVGIVGVNQSVGNMSNQANIVSVAAVGSSLPTF